MNQILDVYVSSSSISFPDNNMSGSPFPILAQSALGQRTRRSSPLLPSLQRRRSFSLPTPGQLLQQS
ncbi:hypothetical protein TSAR_009412 [Trichomalopsis sarcophagae]|uniref:Uncharacterized protein n=1 Tax=Trichomalopsis sarcophagae TaxID=543379 RepID=A0A232EZ63_9HYME|nr:hypothetical protein TSAR_009412 [Trichomalopsis sarcophagae]